MDEKRAKRSRKAQAGRCGSVGRGHFQSDGCVCGSGNGVSHPLWLALC